MGDNLNSTTVSNFKLALLKGFIPFFEAHALFEHDPFDLVRLAECIISLVHGPEEHAFPDVVEVLLLALDLGGLREQQVRVLVVRQLPAGYAGFFLLVVEHECGEILLCDL